MEFRNVTTFIAVARHKNLSRAAAELGYSQSAVTMQLKALERELGTRLFDRVPHGVVLTDPGRAFLFHAREIERAADAAASAVREGVFAGGDLAHATGTLRVGSAESVATGILPELLVAFHELVPNMQVELTTARRGELTRGLAENSLDVFLTMEPPIEEAGLIRETLRGEQISFVAAPSMLGDGGACPLAPDELIRLPFVLTEHGQSYRAELDRMLAERGLSIAPVIEAGSADTLVHLAARGVGATFVPRFSAASALAAGELRELTVDLPPITMDIQMLVHKRKWQTPALKAFMGLARGVM